MRSFRKDAKIGSLVLLAALVVAQAIRIERNNPPVRSDISADPAIKNLLKKACYDCHSNETVWPWYSRVAPVSWLVGSDVQEGRRELNFSEWGSYASNRQEHRLKSIGEEVQDGGMPPWYYSIMHRKSRLKPEERTIISNWAASASAHNQKQMRQTWISGDGQGVRLLPDIFCFSSRRRLSALLE
jgi:hypothetical protein